MLVLLPGDEIWDVIDHFQHHNVLARDDAQQPTRAGRMPLVEVTQCMPTFGMNGCFMV